MSKIDEIKARMSVPAIAAPMFLISNPALVIAACRAGVIGAFPTLNARPIESLEQWMQHISLSLEAAELEQPGKIAPWAANLIVHRSNQRLEDDLNLIIKYKVPIVITALGSPAHVVDAIHDYGGLVFADVNSVAFARKAAKTGVDGLVLICAGAGGHTGFSTPFSFIPAVREFFDGTIVCGGGIANGQGIRAVQNLGADFAYIGTRFIATTESGASDDYKNMLVTADVTDIVTSPYFTGVPANYLLPSIVAAGIDPKILTQANPDVGFDRQDSEAKAWKDIWSAGHSVSAIHDVTTTAKLVAEFAAGYHTAKI